MRLSSGVLFLAVFLTLTVLPSLGLGKSTKLPAQSDTIPNCAVNLFPWIILDRFQDKDGDGEWDDPEPFSDTNGNGNWDPGEPYVDEDGNGTYSEGDVYDPLLTGYSVPFDIGATLTVAQGNPEEALSLGFFYPCRYPPLDYYTGEQPQSGAAIYEEWIEHKSPYRVVVGDRLRIEGGNMQGPTKSGVRDIIDACPTSYYDQSDQEVKGHSHSVSESCPRIGAVALVDPTNAQNGPDGIVTAVKFFSLFVESTAYPRNVLTIRLLQLDDASICDPLSTEQTTWGRIKAMYR